MKSGYGGDGRGVWGWGGVQPRVGSPVGSVRATVFVDGGGTCWCGRLLRLRLGKRFGRWRRDEFGDG